MECITTVRGLQARADAERAAGRRIALVPTMGALHAGHASLFKIARQRADRVWVSIFVNPTQFDDPRDLAAYPRTQEADLAICRDGGVELVFAPDAAEMYPVGAQTAVEPGALAAPLCGAARPGHFRGVATVVTKLLIAAKPHVAVFGEKDYQQLAIIRRMVRDLDFAIEIASVPIVREADGLAMSSRNAYLTAADRAAALSLSKGLAAAERAHAGGERSAAALVAAARAPIEAEPRATIDYVELRDADELSTIDRLERSAVLAMAVFDFDPDRLNMRYSSESPGALSVWHAMESGIYARNGLDVQLVRVTGNVAVMALVDTNGRVVEVQVLASDLEARVEFGPAASDAVWRCEFRPYQVEGRRRQVYALFRFNFTIY